MARRQRTKQFRPRDTTTGRFADVEATRRDPQPQRSRRRRRRVALGLGTLAAATAGFIGFRIARGRTKADKAQQSFGQRIGRLTPKTFFTRTGEQEAFRGAISGRTGSLLGNLASIFGFGREIKARPGRTG